MDLELPPDFKEFLTLLHAHDVQFEACFVERRVDILDGIEVNLISLRHLKANKRASGRLKDLADLEHLP